MSFHYNRYSCYTNINNLTCTPTKVVCNQEPQVIYKPNPIIKFHPIIRFHPIILIIILFKYLKYI